MEILTKNHRTIPGALKVLANDFKYCFKVCFSWAVGAGWAVLVVLVTDIEASLRGPSAAVALLDTSVALLVPLPPDTTDAFRRSFCCCRSASILAIMSVYFWGGGRKVKAERIPITKRPPAQTLKAPLHPMTSERNSKPGFKVREPKETN